MSLLSGSRPGGTLSDSPASRFAHEPVPPAQRQAPSWAFLNGEDRMGPTQRSLFANAMMVLGFIGVFALGWISEPRISPMTLGLLESAPPTALLGLAMLLALYAGMIDISVASVFAVVGVLIGQSEAPTDVWVLASLAFAVVTSAAIGWAAWWLGHPVLVTVVSYFFFRGLASYVSDGVTDTTAFDRSQILQLLDGTVLSIPNQAVVAAVVAAALAGVLFLTNLGREIRTCGIDAEMARAANINIVRTRAMAHLAVGCITGIAAVVNMSYIGTAGPDAGDGLVVPTILVLVLANAGLKRWTPSPARVLLAAFGVSAAARQLLLRGWSVSSTEMFGGAVLLAVMAASRWIEGRGSEESTTAGELR